MTDPRAAGLLVLDYRESCYSIGDRFVTTLDFPSLADLRRLLDPLGLAPLGDLVLGDAEVQVDGIPLTAAVYGLLVSLQLGPEDPHEFLSAADFESARRLAARLAAAGLAAHRGHPLTCDPGFPPPARRKRPGLGVRVVYLIRVERPTATGFACVALRKTLSPTAPSPVRAVLLTPETRLVDHLTGEPAGARAPEIGELLLATLTTGVGPDGTFETIAATAERVDPDPAGVRAAAALLDTCARAGLDLDRGDAPALAREALIERAMDPEWDLAASLFADLLRRCDAYTGGWYGGALAPAVDEMLHLFRRLALPCDLRAHALVCDAEARAAAGADAAALRRELAGRMVLEANRALAAKGDPRRYRPARAGGEPVWLLLEEEGHRGLLRERLIEPADGDGSPA